MTQRYQTIIFNATIAVVLLLIVATDVSSALRAQRRRAVMGKPKIVQIALLPESEDFLPAFYALGSDGSIWIRKYPNRGDPEVWQRIPSPFGKEEAQR